MICLVAANPAFLRLGIIVCANLCFQKESKPSPGVFRLLRIRSRYAPWKEFNNPIWKVRVEVKHSRNGPLLHISRPMFKENFERRYR
jgi:hypothetical protein